MKSSFLLILLLGALPLVSMAQQDLSAYEKKLFISGKDTLRYRILYPPKYKPNKSYPLVMFLHGAGERGNDNEAQLTHGASLFLQPQNRKYFESIVIFPQCPKDSFWVRIKRDATTGLSIDSNNEPPIPQQLVKKLMDSLVENRHVNPRKLYLGGLSMGGFGTYDLLTRYPKFFTAAIAICGIADIPRYVQQARNVPLWIFHGDKDPVVSVQPNRELYKALMTAGAKTVSYSEYPGVGHDSWTNAFAEPRLLPWLFSQKKKGSLQ